MQDPGFFITGGTLPASAPSYIERAADRDLTAALLAGEFCYVLDTRQMGKSSLIVRTAARLRAAGIRVGLIDLTSIGTNVSCLEWYNGLLDLAAESLQLTDDAEAQWAANSAQGPAQRWMSALVDTVSSHVPGHVVIFVDEIDATLGLPFSADDFFAGIRACYNRRAHAPEFQQITFCLVGVASPAELIREPSLSPFNIGIRIQLSNFTRQECAPLIQGLRGGGQGSGDAARMLDRILYWTSGHPYMTQRLCRIVAQERHASPGARPRSPARLVDAVCSDLFFAPRARNADSSLAFVRTRLLDSHNDVSDMLEVYQQLLRGERTPYVESNGICSELVLSGVARVEDSRLVLRNRIYRHVFNMAWVRASLPGAELRRQQHAFRRGVARTWLLAASIIAVMGALTLSNARNARRARIAEAVAKSTAAYARARSEYADHLVYDFNVIRAMQWYGTDGLGMVDQQLDEARPASSAERDLRGFDWYYLRHVCRTYLHNFPVQSGGIVGLALSPDGRYLASACAGYVVSVWNVASGKPLFIHPCPHEESIQAALAWSPDGRQLAIANVHGYVHVLETAAGREIGRFRACRHNLTSVAYSHGGSLLVTGSNDGTARLWDSHTFREIRHVTAAVKRGIWAVAISPDDKILATGGDDGVARLWDMATGRPLRALRGHSWYVYALAFSPDGKTLATASGDTTAATWNVATGSQKAMLRGHGSYVYTVAFSPDGKTIATGSWDHTARLWNAQTGAPIRVIESADTIWALAYCLQGRALALGSLDGSVTLWSTGGSQLYRQIQASRGRVTSVAYAADGARFATCGDDGIARIWDARTGALQGAAPHQIKPLMKVLLRGEECRTVPIARDICDWSPRKGASLSIALRPRPGRVFRAISSDGRLAVEVVARGPAAIRTVDDSSPPVDLAEHSLQSNYMFNASGARVAFQASTGNLVICDTRTGRIVTQMESRMTEPDARPIAFSHDDRLLISRDEIGGIHVWNALNGRAIRAFSGGFTQIICAALTSDDSCLAVGARDGSVTLWDTATWHATLTLANQGAYVLSVAFSPDDQQLISTDSVGKVRIWDAPRK